MYSILYIRTKQRKNVLLMLSPNGNLGIQDCNQLFALRLTRVKICKYYTICTETPFQRRTSKCKETSLKTSATLLLESTVRILPAARKCSIIGFVSVSSVLNRALMTSMLSSTRPLVSPRFNRRSIMISSGHSKWSRNETSQLSDRSFWKQCQLLVSTDDIIK